MGPRGRVLLIALEDDMLIDVGADAVEAGTIAGWQRGFKGRVIGDGPFVEGRLFLSAQVDARTGGCKGERLYGFEPKG